MAVEVWKLLGVEEIIKKAMRVDRAGEAVLEYLLRLLEQEIHVLGLPKLKETVATAAWYLWYERRKLTHREESQSAAVNYIIAYSPRPSVRMIVWSEARNGYVKLNVDAGFDSHMMMGTVGAVIRDHHGKCIVVANEKIELCFDLFPAEAVAIRYGMNLARIVGCSKTEINSDSVEMVAALRDGYSSSVASAIFDDSYFMLLNFTHVIYIIVIERVTK